MILSLIIPIYNTEKFILECLHSILPQLAEAGVELICINDGTTDDAMKLVRKLVENLNVETKVKIILFDQENRGVSEARNKGLELSSGEYIAFIDSDDRIDKKYISEILKCIKRFNPDIIDFNLITSTNKIINVRKGNINSLDSVFKAAAWYNCARVFKKSLINGDQFISGIYYEDLAFFPTLYVKAKNTVYLNKPLYWYRLNSNGITMNLNGSSDIKTINSLEIVSQNFFKLYKDSLNSYFAVAALQSYFLLCVNACRRLGYKDSIYYLKKYEKEINAMKINNCCLSSKLKIFYHYKKNYISLYSLYCHLKYKK